MVSLDRNNLLGIVRYYAALQVLMFHACQHLHIQLPALLANIFSVEGVPIFFSLSGFLVTISWINKVSSVTCVEGIVSYVAARLGRIYPALFLASFLGWLIALIGGKHSFALSWRGLVWLFSQATMFQYYNPQQLRDFGMGVMNGSLWTIPVELQFYIIIPFLIALIGSKKKILRFSATLGIGIIFFLSFCLKSFLSKAVQMGDGRSPTDAPLVFKFMFVSIMPYFGQFLVGAMFVVFLIKLGRRYTSCVLIFAGLLCFAICARFTFYPFLHEMLSALAIAAFFIGIGLIPFNFAPREDLSYGIYIYHMPIANMILASGPLFPPLMRTYVFFFLVFACASLSWFFVEKPCIAIVRSRYSVP